MNKLHIDSLSKSFKETKILENIFLSCKTEEIIGILGRNGSGKSTLFQIISGNIKADYQHIKINDVIIKNQFDRKNRITYLPQYSFLPKNIRVKQLVKLFCTEENASKIIKLPYIEPFLEEKTKNLSSGEQRIIEALLIIYSESQFSLLDEPFHSLSPKMVAELKEHIQEQSKYKGFIISDHQYHDVLDISQSVYLLHDSHLKPIKNFNDLKKFHYLPH